MEEKTMIQTENTARNQQSEDAPKERTKKTAEETVREILAQATKGTIKLSKPMFSRGKEVEEIHFDFSEITGNDIVESLDVDESTKNAGKLSAKQALALYMRMHLKVERPISHLDAQDVIEQADSLDVLAMIRVTQSFFRVCVGRDADAHIQIVTSMGIRTHTPYAVLMDMPILRYMRYEHTFVRMLEESKARRNQ